MSLINGNKIILVVQGNLDFSKIYKGTTLIWEKIKNVISSCYGSGRWIGNLKWTNNDKWKAN